MNKLLILIFYIIYDINGQISDTLRVTLPNGSKLLGRHQFSLHGKGIRSFLGVPYAKPPIGPLRFKAPEQIEPWNGVKEFITNSPLCTQRNPFVRATQVEGQEDCLYMNIYTPQISKVNQLLLLPVMVFMHGGGFEAGGGSMYAPEYLLDNQIIYVAINYRLGVLGFLSTGQEDCPGNNGLKDQVIALKWIKENISAFGGDSNLVTIFGESAGAASVTYQMLSPLSKGLFHRGISESGTYFAPWARPAIGNIAIERAASLGKMMGCSKRGNDWKGMLDCLRLVDAYNITAAIYDFYKWDTDPMVPFPPVIEPNLPGAFLTEHPENIKKPHGFSIPWIVGVNSAEGALKSAPITYIKDVYQSLIKNMDNLAFPVSLYYDHLGDNDKTKITKHIHEFYFNNEQFSLKKHLRNLTNLYSDNWFISGMDEYLNLRLNDKNAAPTFVYLVAQKGAAQFTTVFKGDPNKFYGGSCHADELQFIFPVIDMLFPFVVPTTDDGRLREIIIHSWIHFAKTGKNPMAYSKNSTNWKPATKYPLEYFRFGNLDKPKSSLVGMETGLYDDRLHFWRKLKQIIY